MLLASLDPLEAAVCKQSRTQEVRTDATEPLGSQLDTLEPRRHAGHIKCCLEGEKIDLQEEELRRNIR